MSFSVLISVYKNDKAEDFKSALDSVTTSQTMKPSKNGVPVSRIIGVSNNQ